MVTWIKPPLLSIKLNSDGSCINGNCGGGGVIRTCAGDLIMAYSIPMGRCTSNSVEAGALLFGLKWCIDNGFNMIICEIDSLIVYKSVTGSWTTPWRIEDTTEGIKKLVTNYDIVIQHCFREANKVANKLATISHNQKNNCV